jgi:Arc/MetJ family transcription regulator
MIAPVTMSRITITVDDDVLAEVRSIVAPGEVSAYVLEALRQRLRRDPLQGLLDQLDEWYGPLTDDEKAEGDQWWREVNEKFSSMQEPSLDSPEAIGR